MRQYIGARYVPKFFENSSTNDATWAPNTKYEPLTIVTWNNNSYTSKKPVPANIGEPNLNREYWILTGDVGGAVGALLERMDDAEDNIDDIQSDINTIYSHEEYFLYPTGDKTDRADEIIAKLNTYGTCVLAAGNFYIGKEITMPYRTSICGMGNNSILILNYDGNLIRMNSRCSINNVYLLGHPTNDVPYPNNGLEGERVAILVDGDAIDYSTATYAHTFNMISNVFIRNFNSSGIKCIRTGSSNPGCMVSNCYIQRCYKAINIEFFSEFNIFNNVNVRECTNGCILNGGNNSFTNCQFMRNTYCVKLDNSGDSLLNPDHSLFNGCTFLHPGVNNDGYLLYINGAETGIIFNGCTFFHGIVDIRDSKGIEIVNSIIGINGKVFRVSNSTDCLINDNIFAGVLPTWNFTDSFYSFVNNVHNSAYLDRVASGASSSINSLGSIFMRYTGTLTGLHARVVGTVITEGYINITVTFPKWLQNSNYAVEFQSCTIMNVGAVTLSDIVVASKSIGYVELRIPYTDATKRHESYMVDITVNIAVS